MSQSTRLFCRVPARFIPVWISVAAASGPRDPLEEAVAALCRAGRGRVSEIARVLCLEEGMVQSALDELLMQKLLRRVEDDPGRYALHPDASTQERPNERPGWVAWNGLEQRPLLQIILGSLAEDLTPPAGVEVLDLSEGAKWPSGGPPKAHEVERELRILPSLGDLAVLDTFCGRYRRVDVSSLVRRVRRDPNRRERHGAVYIPLEFRADSPPVVWRPTLLPSQEIHTSLDPQGADGLRGRLSPAMRAQLETRKHQARGDLDAILRERGYQNAGALFDHASRLVQRALAGSWDNPGWERVQELAVSAQYGALLGEMTHADWRQVVHGWADLLDLLTYQLVRRTVRDPESFDALERLTRAPDGKSRVQARLNAHQQVLGPSHAHALSASGKRRQDLRPVLDHGTIGERLSVLALLYACDDEVEGCLRPVRATCPDLFPRLGAALHDRNQNEHFREGSETVSVASFSRNVLELTRAAMTLTR